MPDAGALLPTAGTGPVRAGWLLPTDSLAFHGAGLGAAQQRAGDPDRAG